MANNVKVKTPIGDLRWVFVTGEGKNNAREGAADKFQYVATLILPKDSKEDTILSKQIETLWAEYKATLKNKAVKAKSLGRKVLLDKETGGETGEVAYQFKTNTLFPNGKANNVIIYNAKGEKIQLGGISIGNGSRGVIHGEIAPYLFAGSHGISLYLKAIQLTKLVEYSENLDVDDLSDEGDFESVGDGVPAVEESPEI